MNLSHRKSSEFRFTGWHMLACMGAFFGTIIAVNVTMAIYASGTWTGLVVKNSYVASQGFNAALEASKAQEQAGWRTRLEFGQGEFSVFLIDASGTPAVFDGASLSFGRPAFEQQDQTVDLTERAPGSYHARIMLAPGNWAVRIEGNIEGAPYRRDARVFVDRELSGIVQ